MVAWGENAPVVYKKPFDGLYIYRGILYCFFLNINTLFRALKFDIFSIYFWHLTLCVYLFVTKFFPNWAFEICLPLYFHFVVYSVSLPLIKNGKSRIKALSFQHKDAVTLWHILLSYCSMLSSCIKLKKLYQNDVAL